MNRKKQFFIDLNKHGLFNKVMRQAITTKDRLLSLNNCLSGFEVYNQIRQPCVLDFDVFSAGVMC